MDKRFIKDIFLSYIKRAKDALCEQEHSYQLKTRSKLFTITLKGDNMLRLLHICTKQPNRKNINIFHVKILI